MTRIHSSGLYDGSALRESRTHHGRRQPAARSFNGIGSPTEEVAVLGSPRPEAPVRGRHAIPFLVWRLFRETRHRPDSTTACCTAVRPPVGLMYWELPGRVLNTNFKRNAARIAQPDLRSHGNVPKADPVMRCARVNMALGSADADRIWCRGSWSGLHWRAWRRPAWRNTGPLTTLGAGRSWWKCRRTGHWFGTTGSALALVLGH